MTKISKTALTLAGVSLLALGACAKKPADASADASNSAAPAAAATPDNTMAPASDAASNNMSSGAMAPSTPPAGNTSTPQ